MTTENDLHQTLEIGSTKRKWKKYVSWALPLVLIALLAGFLAIRQKSVSAKATQTFRTEDARTGDLTIIVTATGQLKPTRTVDVGSQVSGIVDQVLVNYNDHVKVGEVIARIDTTRLDAQVQQDKASLQSALAKVEDAKVTVTATEAEYKRMLAARERSKVQIVSQHDLDTAKAAFDRAKVAVTTTEAAVTQAQANLKMDETNVNYAVIKGASGRYCSVAKRRTRPDHRRVLSGRDPVRDCRGPSQDDSAGQRRRSRRGQGAGCPARPVHCGCVSWPAVSRHHYGSAVQLDDDQ